MYNYFMLIGTVAKVWRLNKNEYSTIALAVERPFKNFEGKTEIDQINVNIYGAFMQEMVDEKVELGKVISIKGRMRPTADGNNELIGEKIIFLK